LGNLGPLLGGLSGVSGAMQYNYFFYKQGALNIIKT
jgi:hypothetical protein